MMRYINRHYLSIYLSIYLTTDRHEASHSRSVTAEQIVFTSNRNISPRGHLAANLNVATQSLVPTPIQSLVVTMALSCSVFEI